MGLKTPKVRPGMKSSIAEAPDEFTLFAAAAVPTSKAEVTNRIDLGLFDGCTIQIDYTKGSLTQTLLIPEFADKDVDADYHQATLRDADANGVITVKPISFKITASGKYHVALKKQGRFLRLFLDGDTDNSGSSITVVVTGTADVEEMADVSTDTVTVTPGSANSFTPVSAGTADVQGIAAVANLRLMGFSVTEDAGTPAAAEVVLRHGTSATDPIIARIKLAPDESTSDAPFGTQGIAVASGVFVDRVSGTTELSLYHRTEA